MMSPFSNVFVGFLSLLFPFLLLPSFLPFCFSSSLITDFPNPLRDGQFAKCKMPRQSFLCDPEDILSAEERQKIAQILDTFQDQTKNDGGQNGCKKKGVTGAVALSKKPLYFEMNAMGKLFNNSVDAPFRLLHQWELDNECHKAFLLALPIDSFNFGRVAFYFAMPILQDEINHLYAIEQQFFKQKRWSDAIIGILIGIRKIVNDRHGTLSGDSAEGGEDGEGGEEKNVLPIANNSVAHSSSVLPHFVLSICTVFASVVLTIGILWAFRARIFAMRYDIPLVHFNTRTMDN